MATPTPTTTGHSTACIRPIRARLTSMVRLSLDQRTTTCNMGKLMRTPHLCSNIHHRAHHRLLSSRRSKCNLCTIHRDPLYRHVPRSLLVMGIPWYLVCRLHAVIGTCPRQDTIPMLLRLKYAGRRLLSIATSKNTMILSLNLSLNPSLKERSTSSNIDLKLGSLPRNLGLRRVRPSSSVQAYAMPRLHLLLQRLSRSGRRQSLCLINAIVESETATKNPDEIVAPR